MLRSKILGKLIPLYKEHERVAQSLTNEEIKKKIEHIINKTKTIENIPHEKLGNRDIKKPKKYNFEEILTLRYFQYLLKDIYNVRHLERSYIIKNLLNTLPNVHLYNEITIFKCDFKNFFESVSIKKVINILNENQKLNETEKKFLKKYLISEKKIYPGIGLNNILIDIVSSQFDQLLIKDLKKYRILSYSRYVDDIIIIFNRKVNEDQLLKEVRGIAIQVFGKEMDFNTDGEKYCYYIKENNEIEVKIDYLGYNFSISGKKLRMGISPSKIERIKMDIEKIFEKSMAITNIDDRNRYIVTKLDVFFKRVVFFDKEKWKVRGISDSYKELKYNLNYGKVLNVINSETLKIFSENIEEIYIEKFNTAVPRLLKNQIDNEKFLSLFFKNKSIVLDKRIGMNYKDLIDVIKIIEIDDPTIILRGIGYKKAKKIFLKNTLKKS